MQQAISTLKEYTERPSMDQLRDTDFTGIPFLMHLIRVERNVYGKDTKDAIKTLRFELQYIANHYSEEEILGNKHWLPTFVKESSAKNA